mgnify:CR=1 FL=1
MLDSLYLRLADLSPAALIIIPLAIMFFCAFGMTRITKRLRLPSVTAYLTAGILIGPCCLNLIPQPMIEKTDFLADLALCFIAFSAGEFFKLETLRKNGWKVVWVTIAEACAASLVVFGVPRFLLGLTLPFCVVLAALASATAPASTMMTIRQTGAQGELVDTLLQVVALDDVVSLLAYSAAIAFALHSLTGRSSDPVGDLLVPIGTTLGMLILGGVCGLLLKWLLPATRTTDNRLILALGVLFAFCGLCDMLEVSPLLGCMSMGMVYINLTDDKRLFQQLNYFSPPILLLFFVRSGLNFDLDALVDNSESIGTTPLVVVGILYFLVRIVGKYAGAFLGCLVTKKDKKVRNFLGLALIPQAGVAIGLAATGARTLGGEVGNALETIILASSVLYELIGPACAKLSLYLSGSYSNKLEDLAPIPATEPGQPPKSEVELLIERIQAIQQELPKHNNPYYEDEQAFTEAAAEHSAQMEAFFGTPGKANTAMPGRKRK